jgi:hypothetical protein
MTQLINLEYFKVKMQQSQQGDDHEDNETAVEQIFQDVPPEKADDHEYHNGSQYDQHPPDNLIVRDRGKINRHSDLLNGYIA